VLGVPDEMMGDRVGAVIVPVPGTALEMTVVFDYLADFKIP
jgi:long-chain acyl-CoA synthetase